MLSAICQLFFSPKKLSRRVSEGIRKEWSADVPNLFLWWMGLSSEGHSTAQCCFRTPGINMGVVRSKKRHCTGMAGLPMQLNLSSRWLGTCVGWHLITVTMDNGKQDSKQWRRAKRARQTGNLCYCAKESDKLKMKRKMLKMLGRDERNEVQEFGVTYGQGRQSGHGFV